MLRVPQARPSSRRAALGWSLPSARTVAIAAAIVITAVLILELGIWYFVGLIAIYAALDVAQRAEVKRDARIRMAIMGAAGQQAGSIAFFGLARHCHRAAWVARQLGWHPTPLTREGWLRRSIRFRFAPGAAPLSAVLDALNEERLATDIRLRNFAPSFGRRLAEQSYWDAGDGI
jgi:hypothetical protein